MNHLNIGNMVVLSDYWENELVIITSIDSEKDECEVFFSQSRRRDVFRLSFLSSSEAARLGVRLFSETW